MAERQKDLTSPSISEVPYEIARDANYEGALRSEKVAIYHLVLSNDTFDTTADVLVRLVKQTQDLRPNMNRALYLDIEDHRNAEGGFDQDMFELQRYFILGVLMPYISELYMPLLRAKNQKLQRSDLPSEVKIVRDLNINAAIDQGVEEIWLPEKGVSLRLNKRT